MEFTACGVCCHPAALQGFLEDGLRWLLAQHSRDLSSSLAQTALLKMRSNYITLLIFHYLLWCFFFLFIFFCFFHFPKAFSPAAVGNSQTQRPPSHSSLLSPPLPSPRGRQMWRPSPATTATNSDGSLSVSLSTKCCLTNKSPKPAVPRTRRGHKY